MTHPFAPPFAADGVDELLTCFVPRRSTKLRAESPTALAVRCRDVDAGWTLHLDGDGVTTTKETGEGAAAACAVTGAACDLYLALWNRSGPDPLTIEGDASVLDLFLDRVNVRWS